MVSVGRYCGPCSRAFHGNDPAEIDMRFAAHVQTATHIEAAQQMVEEQQILDQMKTEPPLEEM